MMRHYLKFGLFLFLAFAAPAQGQVAENMPFRQFQEFSQAEMRNFSIGSYGFDAANNPYNPHYDFEHLSDSISSIDDFENIAPGSYYSIGGNFNISGGRETTGDITGRGDFKKYDNAMRFRPNIAAEFWYRQFAGKLSYSNEVLLHQKQSGGTSSYQFSSLEIETTGQEIGIEKNTLQVSLSMLTSPSLSLTLGALTSSFRYIWDLNVIEPAEFETGLFNNFQYLFAANYRIDHRWSTYLTFKTQTSRVSLPEGIIQIETIKVNFPLASVSYYGHIGYGARVAAGKRWHFSLEMRHQFLEISDTSMAALSAGATERHIWNNEMIAGTTFELNKRIRLGIMASKYIKYDNNLDLRYIAGEVNGEPVIAFAQITKPYSLVLSGELDLGRFIINGAYQISNSTYKTGEEVILKDTMHLFSLNLRYYFLW